MSEEIKEIPLKERIEKLLESGWVNEFNYLESQLQEARYLVVILQQKVEQLENIRKEAIECLTSYESISTIQGLDDIEKNKILDEKTMNEMVNRYLKVHDDLLNILNKGSESNVNTTN